MAGHVGVCEALQDILVRGGIPSADSILSRKGETAAVACCRYAGDAGSDYGRWEVWRFLVAASWGGIPSADGFGTPGPVEFLQVEGEREPV